MRFEPISGYDGGFPVEGGCRLGGVCVPGVDVVGLSEEGLRGRLKEIGRAESRLGAMKSQMLAAKVKELWNAEDPKVRRTPQQRMADALAELILEAEKGKAKGIALLAGGSRRWFWPLENQTAARAIPG